MELAEYLLTAFFVSFVLFAIVRAVREVNAEAKLELKEERAQLEHQTLLNSIALKSQGKLKDIKTPTGSRQGTIVHRQYTMFVDINAEDPSEGTSTLSNEEDPYSFSFRLTNLNMQVPSWFSCTIGPKRCTLNMGPYKIDVTQRKAFVNIFSPDIAKRLLKLSEHTTIKIQGDPMRIVLTGQTQLKDKEQEDAFVLRGATFPFVMRDLVKSLPNTSKKMEKRFLIRIQDPFMLTQFYVQQMTLRQEITQARKFIERTLETSKDHALLVHLCTLFAQSDHLKWSEDFIREVIAHVADIELLKQVLSLPPFLNMLANVSVSTKRAIELLHVMHTMAHHNSSATHALMNQIQPQHIAPDVIAACPDTVSKSIAYLWSTDAPHDDVAQAYDRAAHIMRPDDAANLIKGFAKDAPELCTHARIEAALNVDTEMAQRRHLYEVVYTLRVQNPALFKTPQWLTCLISVSDNAPKDNVDSIVELLTRHAQRVHYEQLHEIATLRLYRGHPLRASLAPVLEAIKRRSPHGGLNLSESTQSGQLTALTGQDGELSIKE